MSIRVMHEVDVITGEPIDLATGMITLRFTKLVDMESWDPGSPGPLALIYERDGVTVCHPIPREIVQFVTGFES